MNVVYHAEQACQSAYRNGNACRNKAYWECGGKYVCGVHSKGKERVALPVNPNKELNQQREREERDEMVKMMRQKNYIKNVSGDVVCAKLRMMKPTPHQDGYLKVFPNYKHQHRADGFGCAALSPKSIGPVDHGQPGLPAALNLENFHQFNKVFDEEIDENGNPTDAFYETQRNAYQDPVPHRHKPVAAKIKGNKNIPAFSLWRRKDGSERRCTYFESRQFYCHFFERAVFRSADFISLKKMIADGTNLMIIGYDGYDVGESSMEGCYLDTSRPFGHELVLYTMLTHRESEWPWRKYKDEEY